MYEILYNWGIKFRNPSLVDYLNFLKQSDNWTLKELEEYQLQRAKELIKFANKYSDYYRELFSRSGINPESIKTIEDIKKIPITNKQQLLKYNKQIHTNFHFKKLFLSETSGSTGIALKFYRNEEWDSYNRASMYRGYSWYNVSPWERNGYLWGYNFDFWQSIKTKILDNLQNRFRLFTYNKDEIKRFIFKLQNAKYLTGYSSMIYEVAKIVNQLKIENSFNLKMIKGTAEKIFDSYQIEVKKAFGKNIVSEYGSAESGLIAFECPNGSMHINMENVIVEEENNEIIVTNLNSYSFPIIRYKLGDYIRLEDKKFECPCGRAHPIIKDIFGRVGYKILGKNNIYPSLTLYYIFKNLSLIKRISLNYQAIQKERGKLILRIEQNNSEIYEHIKKEVDKYFNKDIEVEIQLGADLISKNGKRIDFISYLDEKK